MPQVFAFRRNRDTVEWNANESRHHRVTGLMVGGTAAVAHPRFPLSLCLIDNPVLSVSTRLVWPGGNDVGRGEVPRNSKCSGRSTRSGEMPCAYQSSQALTLSAITGAESHLRHRVRVKALKLGPQPCLPPY